MVRVTTYEHGLLICEGISPQQTFKIYGAPGDLDGIYTIYGLIRVADELHEWVFGQDTLALVHPPKAPFAKVTLMDLCSRMGGAFIGSQLIGMHTIAFVERSPLACDALRANFSCPVIQGELGATTTLDTTPCTQRH